MQLGSIIREVQTFTNNYDDDLVDRYNHRYTVMFLAFFILVVATKQYYGEPIVWYKILRILSKFPVREGYPFLLILVGLPPIFQDLIMLTPILYGNFLIKYESITNL